METTSNASRSRSRLRRADYHPHTPATPSPQAQAGELSERGVQELDGLHGERVWWLCLATTTVPAHAGSFKPYLVDSERFFVGIPQGLSPISLHKIPLYFYRKIFLE